MPGAVGTVSVAQVDPFQTCTAASGALAFSSSTVATQKVELTQDTYWSYPSDDGSVSAFVDVHCVAATCDPGPVTAPATPAVVVPVVHTNPRVAKTPQSVATQLRSETDRM